MITKTYEAIKPFEFYRKFFELFNVVQTNHRMRLRDREIDIISAILCLDSSYKFTAFKAKGKEAIIEIIKEHTGDDLTLNNIAIHLLELKRKNIIVEQPDNMKYINPSILKYLEKKDNNFEFAFKFSIKDEKHS